MRSLLYVTLVAGMAACSSGGPASTPAAPTPEAMAPGATHPAITAGDLRTRLFIFADDSMQGREAGTIGDVKGTNYLAAEARRIGLEPAGDNGTYFQTIPMVTRTPDTARTITVGSTTLHYLRDYIPVPSFGFFPFGAAGSFDGAQAVFGGRLGTDSLIDPAQAAGKVVVFLPPMAGTQPNFQFWQGGGNEQLARYSAAAGLAIASMDVSPPQMAGFLSQPVEDLANGAVHSSGPLGMLVTSTAARTMLGTDVNTAAIGVTGPALGGGPGFNETPVAYPARNVVGILRGSDPARRNEYVAIGAHNDHIGIAEHPTDHDSIWAYDHVIRPGGAEDQPRQPTEQEAARIRQIIDSLRLVRPPRQDSIRNGADDDGSGSVTVLEIAEYFANQRPRPARSLLFVWHTAEEKGLFGSQYFTEHPSVPRDSIVAQLNMDMIGRGGAADIPGGGPAYMQLIGSRRLSTELGDIVEAVNTNDHFNFDFDYQFDADGHPANYYCRSDHYMYARFGIPIVFFTTGSHPDYHMLTDEPQYINYDKMSRVARFVAAVADSVANLDHRPVVDHPKPDPYGVCQQ